jgi:hypothetical protein
MSDDQDGIFDGERLRRTLHRQLERVNHALKDYQASLPDFEVKEISVALTADIAGNVGLLGMGGIEASRSRTFEFVLTTKPPTEIKQENSSAS